MALSRINEIRKTMVSKAETDDELRHILYINEAELFREYVQNCTEDELYALLTSNTDHSKTVKVSDIRIFTLTTGHVKAMCNIVLNDCFQVRSIRIMDGVNGLFVAYPNDPFYTGDDFRSICTPITREVRELIENAVLEAYQAHIAEK